VLPVSGALTALNQATIKAKVAADVEAMLVPEGVPVKRGQIIVRLDSTDLKARLSTQQAAEEEARARLALAIKNRESNQMLLKQKFISQNAFDVAQNNVELAQAGLKSARSQLEIVRRACNDALVRAPMDGIISKRFVQTGEKVAPDMALFSLVDLKQLIFEAQVPASDIPRVKVGQEVRFHVDGFESRLFSGQVTRINPMAELGSRSMLVYVLVNNADGALKGGMFAKGQITLDQSAIAPLLPLAALRQEKGLDVVYKIKHNQVVVQPVTLGLRNEEEGLIEVTSGLAPGEQVIAAKLDGVTAGVAVILPHAAPVLSPIP